MSTRLVHRMSRLVALTVILGGLAIATVSALAARAAENYRNPTPGVQIALQIPGMHRAKVRRNVTYARRAGRRPRLDVYRPAGSKPRARLPGVLLVHGTTSDPSPKDWGIYVGWGQLLAASGLAGIPFKTVHLHREGGPGLPIHQRRNRHVR